MLAITEHPCQIPGSTTQVLLMVFILGVISLNSPWCTCVAFCFIHLFGSWRLQAGQWRMCALYVFSDSSQLTAVKDNEPCSVVPSASTQIRVTSSAGMENDGQNTQWTDHFATIKQEELLAAFVSCHRQTLHNIIDAPMLSLGCAKNCSLFLQYATVMLDCVEGVMEYGELISAMSIFC